MKDLTTLFSLLPDGPWSIAKFQRVLRMICESIPHASIDWDDGAGERWGRLVQDSNVCAIASTTCPLVFANADLEDRLSNLEDLQRAHVEFVEDMKTTRYSINLEVLRSVLPEIRISEGFSPLVFTIEELWWASV